MKSLNYIILACIIGSTSAIAADIVEKNPISVHVLNLQTGLPNDGVKVVLEKQEGDQWMKLSDGITNQDGRISALYPTGEKIVPGNYKITFETGDYYKNHNQNTFFTNVPVVIQISKVDGHYHIPLLLSPYGYSTYRGN